MNVDWLIVGAGLSGATLAERIASQRGESVLIVEKRDHIAGNAYDEYNDIDRSNDIKMFVIVILIVSISLIMSIILIYPMICNRKN